MSSSPPNALRANGKRHNGWPGISPQRGPVTFPRRPGIHPRQRPGKFIPAAGGGGISPMPKRRGDIPAGRGDIPQAPGIFPPAGIFPIGMGRGNIHAAREPPQKSWSRWLWLGLGSGKLRVREDRLERCSHGAPRVTLRTTTLYRTSSIYVHACTTTGRGRASLLQLTTHEFDRGQ